MLSDLRESGAIEQDADIVSFIYRPEYYGILEDEEGNSLAGVGEILIAKNRHGSLDNVKLRFIGKYAKFADLEDLDFNELPTDAFGGDSGMISLPSKMNDDVPPVKPSEIDDIPF